jgi:tetratricopeptide (TPR) repeat protein
MTRTAVRFLIPVLLLLATLPLSAQDNNSAIWNYRTGRDMERRNRTFEAEYFYSQAIRICNDEISKNIATSDTYTTLTWTLQRQKKYQDVITWGERGLRLFSDEHRILETMGEAYFYLEDHNESLRYMQRFANAVPQGERTSVAYFFIGEIYRLRKQYYHADIAYSTAVRLAPSVALWWYRLGLVREAMEDFPQAVNAYGEAIKIDPNNREAIDALARSRKRVE